jgi:pyruvate formate-lyase activating enzyme-like uncharacterized protein
MYICNAIHFKDTYKIKNMCISKRKDGALQVQFSVTRHQTALFKSLMTLKNLEEEEITVETEDGMKFKAKVNTTTEVKEALLRGLQHQELENAALETA